MPHMPVNSAVSRTILDMRTIAILLATSVIALTSCKDHMRDEKAEVWKEELAKSIQDFENRKIYKRLTPEILASIPDDKLEQAIIDYVFEKVARRYDQEAQLIRGMSVGIRATHATWVVEAEVINGGFNQFFWNPSGQYAAEAVAGFKLFELPILARLLEQAIEVNQKEALRLGKFKRRASLEAFSESYKENPLNDLDKQFYEAAKSLSATRVAFIRKRPELFVGE
jgi:hypothetical protein